MNRHGILHILGIIASFVAIAIVIVGCSDNNTTEPESTPPDLPPMSSFVMTFDDFQNGSQKISTFDTFGDADSMSNWGDAALTVLVWNTVLTVTLVVPVASFVAAFQHEAVRQTDGSWNWSYSFTAGGAIHTAVLNGKIDADSVLWRMRISKQDEFSDFLWYYGSHNLAGTEGTWTLNHNPQDPTPFLGIEWNRDPDTNTGDLKYTNIIPGNAENGGYIHYGSTVGPTYDRFYDVYNKGLDNHTSIEWNFESKAGRIQDEHYYGDADWRCWNESLINIDCAE